MPGEAEVGESPEAVFYGQHYARIDSELAAEIRREVFDEDFGQESWRSAAEQAEIADLLRLTSDSRALDVACGAGGPSLALAERWGCFVTGLDIEPEGIAHANAEGARRGFTARVSFAAVDCAGPLPFADDSFDAILCIDAISHLPDRTRGVVGVAAAPSRGRSSCLHRPVGRHRADRQKRDRRPFGARLQRLLRSAGVQRGDPCSRRPDSALSPRPCCRRCRNRCPLASRTRASSRIT